MDKIIMRQMVFKGYHGVFEEEKKSGQPFVVDVELGVDLRPAGVSDDVADTVSYAEAHELVKAIVEGPSVDLVEHLAERIATVLLDTFTRVAAVTVRVMKPEAPVDGEFESFGVEICRRRGPI